MIYEFILKATIDKNNLRREKIHKLKLTKYPNMKTSKQVMANILDCNCNN